tara:strand:- start:5274 stop:5384 length:111 start_codon:yes stop_codon:yes gene_type:complete
MTPDEIAHRLVDCIYEMCDVIDVSTDVIGKKMGVAA